MRQTWVSRPSSRGIAPAHSHPKRHRVKPPNRSTSTHHGRLRLQNILTFENALVACPDLTPSTEACHDIGNVHHPTNCSDIARHFLLRHVTLLDHTTTHTSHRICTCDPAVRYTALCFHSTAQECVHGDTALFALTGATQKPKLINTPIDTSQPQQILTGSWLS